MQWPLFCPLFWKPFCICGKKSAETWWNEWNHTMILIFNSLLIFVPVPFFHLTFIHLQFCFSAWKGSYPPWKSQGKFLCSISKMHQLKLSGSHLSGKTNKQTKYKSHFLRKSRIARHLSKNRIFYSFAKTSRLVT